METKPAKRPRGRPPKHGAYTGAELIPVTDMKRAEIVEVLEGERTFIKKTDMIAVNLLARALAKLELFDRYMAANDWMVDGELNPVMKAVYWSALNAAQRLCNDLGLTPAARNRIGGDLLKNEKDLGTLMKQAREMEEDE